MVEANAGLSFVAVLAAWAACFNELDCTEAFEVGEVHAVGWGDGFEVHC